MAIDATANNLTAEQHYSHTVDVLLILTPVEMEPNYMEKMALAFSSQDSHPIVRAFIRDQVKVPDTFNANIHPDDEMLSYILKAHNNDREKALLEYFMSGQTVMHRVRDIVNWKFKSFDKISSFLEFACGYGRFTRFLVQEFPASRLWVSDIYANAVQFQKEQFGTNGVVSVPNPDDYPSNQKYDFILVASLFSHLPEKTFIPWLKKLYSLLLPGGLLMFSVHDESVIPSELTMPDSGFLFWEDSETDILSRQEYGSTWVSESFVRQAIHQVTRGEATYHRIKRGLWQQDLYLVVNEPNTDFSDLNFGFGSMGCLDSCTLTNPNELTLTGWAVETTPGAWLTDIQILIDGRLVQRCLPFSPRPDVAQYLEDERFLISGWKCSCYLGQETDWSADTLMVKLINSNNIEQVLHVRSIKAALSDYSNPI